MALNRFIFLFFGFLFLSVAVFARDIEIMVEDEELSLPLEGAVVSLRSGERFVCDEDGRALVTLEDDRQQIVQISYPGYDAMRLTIPAAGGNRFTVSLRLSGLMEGRELVLEAQRPETSETKSGRSVAISERELTRTAEIGIIEDVMSSVKLLPGVGYTGVFGATPSIRGGDPGDLVASFDGFYLERPYHWVGAVSIFDPKMVSSARLSHGVFSSRYGHTTSGLLEITSRSPSSTEVEMETAISTSAVSLNLSYPLGGRGGSRGGVLFMGKVTYWDTLIWTMKGLSRITDNETLDAINAISTSPYIRSAALAANYRISADMEWRLNFFFGSDGVGAEYKNDYDSDDIRGRMDMTADYDNYQGFLVTGLTISPSPVVALKAAGGAGFIKTVTNDYIINDVTVAYNDDFLKLFPDIIADEMRGSTYTAPNANIKLELDHTIFNTQGRVDADWDLGKGFIAAFGVQALYSRWAQKQYIDLFLEMRFDELPPLYAAMLPPEYAFITGLENAAIIRPMGYYSDILNHGLTSSGYTLVEYTSPGQRFGAELGLRLDHLYFRGNNFSVQTKPAFNPRLNIDFNLLKNVGILDSLDFTVGSGLFSSINALISFADRQSWFGDIDLKFNRSWTSIAGVKADLAQRYSFNIEGYYKRIFDRAYITADIASTEYITPSFHFDGVGNVGGFDLQLQKLEARYWDGWISYTFTWAKYYDPSGGGEGVNMGSIDSVGSKWYYPSFHRFHNCNIVLNIKPIQQLGIATRFGFASGQMRTRAIVDKTIYSYPVVHINDEGNPEIIQKYRRDTLEEVLERGSWSLPWDLKLSFFPANRKGRANTEIYLAAENLMSLFYKPAGDGNTRFNEYTGVEDTAGSSSSMSFDLPIPLISFGFKWKY